MSDSRTRRIISTSSSFAWIEIPAFSLFVVLLSFLTYRGRLTVDAPFEGDAFSESFAPWVLCFVVAGLIWKIYDAACPSEFRTTITGEQLTFAMRTRKPRILRTHRVEEHSFLRSSVLYIYPQPYRWYHGDVGSRPIIVATSDGNCIEIDQSYISTANHDEFVTSIQSLWGAKVYQDEPPPLHGEP